MLSIYERLNTDYIDRIKQDIHAKYRPLISQQARDTKDQADREALRLAALDHTDMTLDQLKAEYHVVSQRLDRHIYRDDKAELEERQDKLLLSIKRKERR